MTNEEIEKIVSKLIEPFYEWLPIISSDKKERVRIYFRKVLRECLS